MDSVRVLTILTVTALVAPAAKADGPAVSAPAVASFGPKVGAFLTAHCVKCHSGAKAKGGVDLASREGEDVVARDPKTWEKVLEAVSAGDMPPAERPQPPKEEVERLTKWVEAELSRATCRGLNDPGRVTIRRLNRNEYNNTIRDLFGIDVRPADDFPTDDVGYGFDNNGDVLALPPVLFEKYLAAAEAVAEKAIVVERPDPGPTQHWEAEGPGPVEGGNPHEGGRMLASEGEVAVNHTLPKTGEYRFRARVTPQQAGPEPVRMAMRVDGKALRNVKVTVKNGGSGTFELKAKLHGGPRRFAVAFLNDYYNPNDPNPKNRDRNLEVDWLEVQGPFSAEPPPLPDSHTRIIFKKPTPTTKAEVTKEILDVFASRAFRRPASRYEVERLTKLVEMAEKDGERFERGIQLAVEAVLVSPHFLYRVELDRGPKKPGTARSLNDYELASRLSYFLWSSAPDDTLFELAKKKELRTGRLVEQVRRMLKDPKAKALVENFAGQWLQLRNLKTVNPDRGQFPGFDDGLRDAMRRETELFFQAVIDDDRPLTDFLDSDFTFLNERLARHYGVPGVSGDEFRRIALTDGRRGGVLTQASVLTVTSNPTRTSPVKRGKWILEQVLGAPPPPPPPGTPDLPDGKHGPLTGTLRQRMEQHRANPNCATCHARLDPLGFGFENFDAVGAWRDQEGGATIDSSGVLPSGQSFRGPKELKAILIGRKQEFTRCLAEKLLTYALGRGLDFHDRCAVDKIVAAVAQDNDRFSRLVLEVVRSDPFLKRGVEAKAAGGSR